MIRRHYPGKKQTTRVIVADARFHSRVFSFCMLLQGVTPEEAIQAAVSACELDGTEDWGIMIYELIELNSRNQLV